MKKERETAGVFLKEETKSFARGTHLEKVVRGGKEPERLCTMWSFSVSWKSFSAPTPAYFMD